MRRWIYLLALMAGVAQGAPSVLTLNPASDSGVRQVPNAVTATVGGSLINNPIFIDQDAVGAPLVSDSGNSSATTIVSMANPSGGSVNHAPYQVIAWPVQGTLGPEQYYAQLQSQIGVISLPHGGGSATNHQLPSIATIVSSPNSLDGNTGWGVTFGLSKSYLGLNTTSDSNDTGITAGLLVALLYNHPSWNAFDAHAALRQTASLWATGYDHTNFGFGFVNWASANTASTIYLQTPEMKVTAFGSYVQVVLYPFRQTRRTAEVVYSCTPGYAWPTKNEYALSDVTAGCGTLLYTSNGTDVTPTFLYAPALSGMLTLVAFTTDGTNYSRVDEFGPVTSSVTVTSQCH